MRCIYKIINVVNNKFYVGSAVNFEKRKARHLWRLRRGDHVNKHLQAAWNKYGAQAFIFAIVEEVPDTKDLLQVENSWLHEHVGNAYCYNKAKDATAPGVGMHGEKNAMWGKTFTHTEGAKQRIGKAAKTRVQSDSEKAKRRATMKGHEVSTETRLKISASLSGKGNYWYGKQRPDHGAKVSKAVLLISPKEQVRYSSIQALRGATGMKPPTVNRALKSGSPITRGKFVGYSIKYVDMP